MDRGRFFDVGDMVFVMPCDPYLGDPAYEARPRRSRPQPTIQSTPLKVWRSPAAQRAVISWTATTLIRLGTWLGGATDVAGPAPAGR